MKRILPVFILVLLLFTTIASAAVLVVVVSPSLSFTGTTANCKASVTDYGKYISATMELYENGNCVASWNGSGTNKVTFNETYGATSGYSYYVRIYGTSGGTSFDKSTTVKICP